MFHPLRLSWALRLVALFLLLGLLNACAEDGASRDEEPAIEMLWAKATIDSCGQEQIENVATGYSQHGIPQEVNRIVFSIFTAENAEAPYHTQEVYVKDLCDQTGEASLTCVVRNGGSYLLYNVPVGKNMRLRAEAFGTWDGRDALLYTADNFRVSVLTEQTDPTTQAVPVKLFMKRVERLTGGFNCLPTAVAGHAVTVLRDGRLLITGGVESVRRQSCDSGMLNCDLAVASKQVAIFDPTSGEFTQMNPMSQPRAAHQTVLLADGTILITGGASQLFLRYTDDAQTDAGWPARRIVFEAPLDKIHVSAEIYNPSASGSVSKVVDMNSRRMFHTLTPLDTDDPSGATWFLMAGGFGDAENGRLDSLEIIIFNVSIDPSPRFMLLDKTLLTQRAGHTATRLPDGRIIFYGGATPEPNNPKASISAEIWETANKAFYESLDVNKGVEVLVADLMDVTTLSEPSFGNYPFEWPNLHHHAATVVANRNAVLIAGGMEKDILMATQEKFIEPTNAAYLLDFDNETLLPLSMSSKRLFPAAAALPSGRVVVSGGLFGLMLSEMTDSIDVLDLESGAQITPYIGLEDAALALPVGRMWHSSTVLPEGGVAWIGGMSADPQVTDTSSDNTNKAILGGAVMLLEEP